MVICTVSGLKVENVCAEKEEKSVEGAMQFRTGKARLNAYLHQIKAAGSSLCACGIGKETVEHFLFHCTRWTAHRGEMLRCTDTHRSNISFYLGGKSLSDGNDWKPNMEAVRATIQFAVATGRLEADQPQE